MPVQAPPIISKIYHPHPIKPENIVLDTEINQKPSQGKVRVRALDGFVFVKDGKFVYPTSVRDEAWWTGVTAYGYAAALTGEYKWFIWAGRWDEEFPGKHIEVVQLKNLCKITKESNRHWRGGLEKILWLETGQGYSYALLEPDTACDKENWGSVVNSWTYIPGEAAECSPGFTPVDLENERPVWWKKAGDKAWNHIIKPIKEEERRQKAAKAALAKKGETSGTKRKSISAVNTSATRRTTRRRRKDQSSPPTSPTAVSSPSPRSSSPAHDLPKSKADRPGHPPLQNQASAKGKSKELEPILTSGMLATKDGIQEETVAGAAEPATQETSVIPERSNPISQITTSGENTIPSLTPPSTQAQSTQGNDNAILESSDNAPVSEQTKKPMEELPGAGSFVNAPGSSQIQMEKDMPECTTDQPSLDDQQGRNAADQPQSAHVLPAVQPEPTHVLPSGVPDKPTDLPPILKSMPGPLPAEPAITLEASQAENAFVQWPGNTVPNPIQEIKSWAGEPASLDERCSFQGTKD